MFPSTLTDLMVISNNATLVRSLSRDHWECDETSNPVSASYMQEEGATLDGSAQLTLWVEQYGDRLFRLAKSYVSDSALAEDCVQDALIKGFQKMGYLRDRDKALPWLMKIVINECKSRLRKNRKFTMLTSDVRYESNPEDAILNKLAAESLHKAIMMLPEKYRLPIILYYFEDIQLDTIAQILKANPGTIRTRIKRAREKLKKIVQEGDVDDSGGQNNRCQVGV